MTTLPKETRHIPLSANLLDVPKSATLAINELSKQLVLEGKDVVRLGLGQSPFPVPDHMVELLRDYASAKDYMAVQGYLPLREAISDYLARVEGIDSGADRIIIGPGSKELFFGLQMALDCDLLLPAPSWVSYRPQATLLDRRTTWLPCAASDGWKLRADTLDAHCRQHAGKRQLLVLNSPNNPSGACFDEQELRDLAAVARRHELIVLSDEIYSELHYQGQHLSMARFYPEGTIVSNGISKWAGAGGWRLGFFHIPEPLRAVLDAMIVIASETFTSVSAPIQMASIAAFEPHHGMQAYIDASRQIMRDIGGAFARELARNGVDCVPSAGGFYLIGSFDAQREALLKRGITNSLDLSRQLLQSTGVAALPIVDFGLNKGLGLRFAFVDFDGQALLKRKLDDPQLELDDSTEELRHLMSAAQRIGDWLGQPG